MKIRTVLLIAMTGAMLFGCGEDKSQSVATNMGVRATNAVLVYTSQTEYMITSHSAVFYNLKYKVQTNLIWGERMVYTGTNQTNRKTVYYKTIRKFDNTIGLIQKQDCIEKPIERGVILSPIVAYESCSIASGLKQQVIPPILVFILEIKDSEWARVQWYNTPPIYNIYSNENDMNGTTWVRLLDISIDKAEVETVIACQLAVYNYRSSVIANGFISDDVIARSKQVLDRATSMYPGNNASGFVAQARIILDGGTITNTLSVDPNLMVNPSDIVPNDTHIGNTDTLSNLTNVITKPQLYD